MILYHMLNMKFMDVRNASNRILSLKIANNLKKMQELIVEFAYSIYKIRFYVYYIKDDKL